MYVKRIERMNKDDEAVSPVIAIILMVTITVVLAGVLYMWVMSLAEIQDGPPLHAFSIEDGPNESDTVGCFFLIRADSRVEINPRTHTFWVNEEGRSPRRLDFSFRDYSQDSMKRPEGGDRNASYRYDEMMKAGRWPDMPTEEQNARWNDGEYLGFDMPADSSGINIVNGNKYEVIIKNAQDNMILQKTFVYKAPY